MKKRVLSILLAALMIVSLLPVTAMADGTHTHNDITFDQWTSDNSLPASGSYYLTKNVTVTNTSGISGTLNLCLNGYSITGDFSKLSNAVSVFTVNNGGVLNLYDCNGANAVHTFTYEPWEYTWIEKSGSERYNELLKDLGDYQYDKIDKQIAGGLISGGTGGGVTVNSGGNLTIYGGTIAGNTDTQSAGFARKSGGGIKVGSGANVIMNGGCIFGNEANDGGGMYIAGSFTMNDGTFFGNYAAQNGGGIYIEGGVFKFNGGNISGNKASKGYGGVYMYGGSFNMLAGMISDNISGTTGAGGVGCSEGTFVLKDGLITGNKADSNGGGVGIEGADFIMEGGTVSKNYTTGCGGGIAIDSGSAVITGGMVSENVANSDYNAGRGGGIYVGDSGHLILSGGDITDNTTNKNGGGLYVSSTDGNCILGGTVKIWDNKKGYEDIGNNLYASSKIDIGNGTGEGKNGCPAPAEGMKVGVSYGNPFTIAGAATDNTRQYFRADNIKEKSICLTDENALGLKSHTHGSWTYSADDNILTATCGRDSCGLPDNKATLTLVNKRGQITFEDDEAETWKALFGSAPKIYYYQGEQSVGATLPKKKGTYTAKVSEGSATATLEFECTAHTVTVICGTAATNSAIQMVLPDVDPGATVTIVANNYEGKLFDGWTAEEGIDLEDSKKSTTTFEMPATDVELIAEFVECSALAVYVNDELKYSQPERIGAIVNVPEQNVPGGTSFSTWEAEGTNLSNPKNVSQSFVMPANAVKLVSVCKYPHTVTVVSGAAISGLTGGKAVAGDLVKIEANAPDENKRFSGWIGFDGLDDATASTTTFTMPDEDVTVTATYGDLEITVPTLDPIDFTYTGKEITQTLQNATDAAYYTVTCEGATVDGTSVKALDAGKYQIVVTLKNEGLKWADGTSEPKTFDFVINKMKVDKPLDDPRTFAANGGPQTYLPICKINGKSYNYNNIFYTVSDNVQTEQGKYTVKIKPMKNFCWKDGTEAELEKEFIIKGKAINSYVYYLKDKNNQLVNYVDLSCQLVERIDKDNVTRYQPMLKDYYTPFLMNAPQGAVSEFYLVDEDGNTAKWNEVRLEDLDSNTWYYACAVVNCDGYEEQKTAAAPTSAFYTADRQARLSSHKEYLVEEGGVSAGVDFQFAGLWPVPVPTVEVEEDKYELFQESLYDCCSVKEMTRTIINELESEGNGGKDCEDVSVFQYSTGKSLLYTKDQLSSLKALLAPKRLMTSKGLRLTNGEPEFNESYIAAYCEVQSISNPDPLNDAELLVEMAKPSPSDQLSFNALAALASAPATVYTILYDPMGAGKVFSQTDFNGCAYLSMGIEDDNTYNLENAIPEEGKALLSDYTLVGVYQDMIGVKLQAPDETRETCALSFGQDMYEWDFENDTIGAFQDQKIYVIYQKNDTTDWENTASATLKWNKGAEAVVTLPSIRDDMFYGTVTSANEDYFTIDETDLANGKLKLKTVEKFENPLTFTVNVEFEFENQTYIAYPITVTVTPAAPSGRSSTPTVTVPVTGDENSVSVQASVSGTTASVKEITDADLAKVGDAKTVEIDLTGLNKDIVTAEIPTVTVEKIGEKAGMTVKLPVATVEFDAEATKEIAGQAEGSNIELVVDSVKEVSLNAVQKESVKKLDTAVIIDAYLASNGSKLCTKDNGGFGGGSAKVILPYEIKNNRAPENYSVFYVAEDGKLQKLNAVYDKELKAFVFEITHFSVYAVAYDEFVNPFTDVSETAYYYDAVKWAAANGVTDGIDDTHFDPNGITNRAQMVTFLWKAAGKPEPTITETPFTDLNPNWYYYKAVLWAYENGITDGTTATTFEPDKNVSRAQTVTFLWRYAGKPVVDYWMQMTDVASGKYYTEAVRWALAEGITEGTSKTTFSPNDDCLRGQIVTFLYRSLVK